MRWGVIRMRGLLLVWILLVSLIGCATTKKIEQTRLATEEAMKAAQETVKRAETIAAKVEEGVKEANRAAARSLEAAGMAEKAAD